MQNLSDCNWFYIHSCTWNIPVLANKKYCWKGEWNILIPGGGLQLAATISWAVVTLGPMSVIICCDFGPYVSWAVVTMFWQSYVEQWIVCRTLNRHHTSSGPGFFVCFLAVSTPEVSWDQLSWAQVYRFRFFCFCVSWAHREQAHEMTGDREQTGKVSHVTLSKAELCNNGPYLDARTDHISPHTSLLPSHTLPHPPKDPLSRISTSRSSQSLDQSSMICRQVVESNYCLLCDVIYPTSLAQASFEKIM